MLNKKNLKKEYIDHFGKNEKINYEQIVHLVNESEESFLYFMFIWYLPGMDPEIGILSSGCFPGITATAIAMHGIVCAEKEYSFEEVYQILSDLEKKANKIK